MNESDKKKFGQLLVTTAELFEKDLSSPVISIYFKALSNFEINQVEDAMGKVVTSCKFFPKPVEIIDFIQGGSSRIEDVALVQADIVVNAIKKIGSYQSVKFKDRVTNAVISRCFGGWMKTCNELLEQNEQWFRKDFVKYYQSYSRQGIISDEVFAGFVEIENTSKGFIEHIPKPIMIDGFEINKTRLIEEK